MKAPLRFDDRVELYEKTDFLRINVVSEQATTLKAVHVDLTGVETVVADVSFISLRRILEHAKNCAERCGLFGDVEATV